MTRIVLIIMNIHEHSNTSKLKLIRGFLRKALIFDTSPVVWGMARMVIKNGGSYELEWDRFVTERHQI